MSDTTRAAFEAYFAASRKSKGAGKRPTFHRLPDGSYSDDHTQRHWWTWQQALKAAQAPAAEPLTDDARDAARYRWLRNEAWGCGNKKGPHLVEFKPGYVPTRFTDLAEEAADAAIDAALAAAKER